MYIADLEIFESCILQPSDLLLITSCCEYLVVVLRQKVFKYLIWCIVVSGFISVIGCIVLFSRTDDSKHSCWLEGYRQYTICEGMELSADKPLEINLTSWQCWQPEPCPAPKNYVTRELKLDLSTGVFGKKTLSSVPELEILTVDIRHLDGIEDGTFCLSPKLHTLFIRASKRMTDLSILALQNCEHVKTLTLTKVKVDPFAWRHMINLEDLTVSDTSIFHLNKNYFENLTNLKRLEVSFSSITTLDPRVLCLSPKLEEFSFHHINLSLIPKGAFENCNSVRSFEFVYNFGPGINSDAIRGLTNVTSLILDSFNNTQLKKDDLPNVHNLEILKIDRSSLNEIDGDIFNELTNLRDLSLINNHFIRFEISSGLNNLTRLYLSDNQLVTFDITSNLNHLTDLYLDGNRLTRFNPDILAHLPNLNELDLSSNRLKSIDGLSHPKLAAFRFSCNEFGDDFNVTALALSMPKVGQIGVSVEVFQKYFEENKLRNVLYTRRDEECS